MRLNFLILFLSASVFAMNVPPSILKHSNTIVDSDSTSSISESDSSYTVDTPLRARARVRFSSDKDTVVTNDYYQLGELAESESETSSTIATNKPSLFASILKNAVPPSMTAIVIVLCNSLIQSCTSDPNSQDCKLQVAAFLLPFTTFSLIKSYPLLSFIGNLLKQKLEIVPRIATALVAILCTDLMINCSDSSSSCQSHLDLYTKGAVVCAATGLIVASNKMGKMVRNEIRESEVAEAREPNNSSNK